MVRVFYMSNEDGDILVSTVLERGYKVKRSYTLNNDIDNTTLWDKIGQLMDEYSKHDYDENIRLYMFSKIFKDHLVPKTCNIL